MRVKLVKLFGDENPNRLEKNINNFILKNTAIFLNYTINPINCTKEQWFATVVYTIEEDNASIVRT